MTQRPDEEAIREIIEKINESWLAGRYEEIGRNIDQDVVVAPPGSPARIAGRDAYVASYREYDEMARTHEFRMETSQVDVIGDVAVAITPFLVDYEMTAGRHRESGREILVFRRSGGEWRVVWRTMQTDPPPA
ncbi:MAG TPA: nuclear transport factor 2 family protein [Thermoanaerobaculia bacterium]|nr:nuclear transport factor 2 family protein [Thermoanaerobaculia bacterium]